MLLLLLTQVWKLYLPFRNGIIAKLRNTQQNNFFINIYFRLEGPRKLKYFTVNIISNSHYFRGVVHFTQCLDVSLIITILFTEAVLPLRENNVLKSSMKFYYLQ